MKMIKPTTMKNMHIIYNWNTSKKKKNSDKSDKKKSFFRWEMTMQTHVLSKIPIIMLTYTSY